MSQSKESLAYLQGHASRPYLETDEFSQRSPIIFLEIPV